jgi:hypothetical protein
MVMKSFIFWDITSGSPFKVNRRFGGTPLAGYKQISVCYVLHADFLRGSFFDPEDAGDMFLRNVR